MLPFNNNTIHHIIVMETEHTNKQETTKPNKITAWLAIVLGVITIVLGSMGVTKDSATDAALVDIGVTVAVSNIVSEYPESQQYLEKVSKAIDTVIQARNGNKDQLIAELKSELAKITDEATSNSVTAVAVRIMDMINEAYSKSENEEVCIKRLQVINDAIKVSLAK